jgi:hypothetical protein
MPYRGSRAIALAVAIVALAACTPGAQPGPSLEPRATVAAALRSTAALRTVHALLELELRDGSSGQAFAGTAEGDVDLASRELDVMVRVEPDVFGTTALRLVVVDDRVFSRTDDTAWSVSRGGEDPLRGIPATADIAEAIEGAIEDPATEVTLTGAEPCGDATCDHLVAVVPREVAWQAVEEMVAPSGIEETAIPEGLRAVTIDLWVEQGTHRLRKATNRTVLDQVSLSISITLTSHDAPVTIEPPLGAGTTP